MASRRRTPDLVARRLPRTNDAIDYAIRRHLGQRRQADGAPFILHPLEVASLLYSVGAPDHVVAAGVLHDVLEKTDADLAELERQFGHATASLVRAVSENQHVRGYAARKAALRAQVAAAGDQALMVFAADKISKVRELRIGDYRAWDRRLVHYQRCLELLEQRLAASPLVATLRAELDKLAAAATARAALAGAR